MKTRVYTLFILIVVLVASCGGGAAPTPPYGPDELLEVASGNVTSAGSFRMVIEHEGAPAYIDDAGMMGFRRAEGIYVAPDRIRASVRILLATAVADAEMIIVGRDQYLYAPLITGSQWVHYTFLPGFDPARMFAEGAGLEQAMGSVRDLEFVGVDDLDGTLCYHLAGVADGEDVADLTLGLIGGGDVEAEIWIEVDTLRIARIVLTEPERATPDEGPPVWHIEIYDYGVPATIEPPITEEPV